jgi:hypothetical protein
MSGSSTRLAVNFFEHRLFYAVFTPGEGALLRRIGSHDFSFSIADAFRAGDVRQLDGVYSVLKNLQKEYKASSVHVVTFPFHESWSSLPKLVHDQSDERESYLTILMKGVQRQYIDVEWHDLSNRDYKMLVLRDRRIMASFEKMGEIVPSTAFNSEFEALSKWHQLRAKGGSYLTIGCHKGSICVSSFLLGKLRGASYIRFETYEDIPYLWTMTARHLKWMLGLHDQILFYGTKSAVVSELLLNRLDRSSDIQIMDTLDKMGVQAEEQTYNFDLSQAFPSILLAMESS